jgi:hypothetical protein
LWQANNENNAMTTTKLSLRNLYFIGDTKQWVKDRHLAYTIFENISLNVSNSRAIPQCSQYLYLYDAVDKGHVIQSAGDARYHKAIDSAGKGVFEKRMIKDKRTFSASHKCLPDSIKPK